MPESAIFQPSSFETEYRATGFVRGRFVFKKQQSQLITSEGVILKAFCCKNLAQLFIRRPDLLEQEYLWASWLRTSKSGKIKLNLKHFLTSPKFPEEELIKMEALSDRFSIRGQVADLGKKNRFSIRIQRNSGATQAERQPFILTIAGTLPEEAKRGQFWELTCRRDHETLVLNEDEAKLIKPCRQRKKKKLNPKPKLKQKQLTH